MPNSETIGPMTLGFDPFNSGDADLAAVFRNPLARNIYLLWRRGHIVGTDFAKQVRQIAERIKANGPTTRQDLVRNFPTGGDFSLTDVVRFVDDYIAYLIGPLVVECRVSNGAGGVELSFPLDMAAVEPSAFCPECGAGVDAVATAKLRAQGKPGIIFRVSDVPCRSCEIVSTQALENAGRAAAEKREQAAFDAIFGAEPPVGYTNGPEAIAPPTVENIVAAADAMREVANNHLVRVTIRLPSGQPLTNDAAAIGSMLIPRWLSESIAQTIQAGQTVKFQATVSPSFSGSPRLRSVAFSPVADVEQNAR